MKIYSDPMDQCFICIGYSYEQDSTQRREVFLRRFQPGVEEKEWWRYRHEHLGLKTLVAYEGVTPVGHIEHIPVQHAPRPIQGTGLTIINCILVAESARGKGIGRELIQSVERDAHEKGRGVAAITSLSGDYMPAAFFEHLGYHQVAQREAEALFFKSTNGSEEPTFLPIRHQATTLEDKIAIDYFHCPQCPMSGWALAGLEKKVKTYPDQVHMQVHPTGERSALERIGIAQAVYIDGLRIRSFPPNPDSLASELEARISAKGGVAD